MINTEIATIDIENFIEEVNTVRRDYYKKLYPNMKFELLTYKTGQRYIKLLCEGSCWGFISKYDGIFKKAHVKIGDLMMAASWSSPAKHSRGNILNGTASYNSYGPTYLK
jgi:hypothetical protein